MTTKEEKANKKDKKRRRRKVREERGREERTGSSSSSSSGRSRRPCPGWVFTPPLYIRTHHQEEEEEDDHDDAEKNRKLDKKLRKLLHLAPAKAQAQAPSIFPLPLVQAPPPPRLPPLAAAPSQAPHLPAFYKHVKDATIPTAPKPNVPIPSVHADAEELRRRQARAQRFAASSSLATSSLPSSSSSAFLSQESRRRKEAKAKDHRRARPLVGTCVVVEKEYMRSMEEVDPATVRPPRVLRDVRGQGEREDSEGGRRGMASLFEICSSV